jgi:hypothetical protein
MVIIDVKSKSGQGNQMFMYARAYALARETNQELIVIFSANKKQIENRPFILDKFELDYNNIKKIVRLDKLPKIIRYLKIKLYRFYYKKIKKSYIFIEKPQEHRLYTQINNNEKNYYLYGYFESYKYFDKYRDELIKQFNVNYELNESTIATLNEIKNCNSIALHIRRGDFVLEGKAVGTEYYKSQMQKARKEIKNPIFYLATTDQKVIEEFKKFDDVRIIDTIGENKDINDWLCLKECKHHIIANSTYSWWAAYLSNDKEKKVYMPTPEEYVKFEKRECIDEYKNFYCEE